MLKTIAHQKETIFLTKPSWGVEMIFFHQAEAFMPFVRFSPQILQKFSRISKKFTKLFIFFMKKLTSRKRFSFYRHIKTQVCQWCWNYFAKLLQISCQRLRNNCRRLFLQKTYIFPQKNHCTQWCTFRESSKKFRQKLTKFRFNYENVFAFDSFAGKSCQKSPSGSVESSGDNRTDIVSSKLHFSPKFWKSSAQILSENTKLLKFFFRKGTFSLKQFF